MPRSQPVTFPGVGGTTLSGVIDVPDTPVNAWALFCHGFTLGKNSLAAARTCRELANLGIGVLRYDAAGLGDSTGNWEDGNFSSKVADVASAAAFMRSTDRTISVAIGHSLGGAAVLAAVQNLPEVDAVATIGAPFEPSHVVHLFESVQDEIDNNGHATVTLGNRKLRIRSELLADLEKTDIKDCIRSLGVPLLVIHSPVDNVVGIENAGEIFRTARHPKSFFSLEESDHLLTGKVQAKRAATIIAAWAEQYLELDGEPG